MIDTDRLRHATDIVALISERMRLSKVGKDYVGLCPFHKEKTPSFTVTRAKAFAHCYGCGWNGDAISFLQDYDHMTFMNACETLAQRAGISLHEDDTDPYIGMRQLRAEHEHRIARREMRLVQELRIIQFSLYGVSAQPNDNVVKFPITQRIGRPPKKSLLSGILQATPQPAASDLALSPSERLREAVGRSIKLLYDIYGGQRRGFPADAKARPLPEEIDILIEGLQGRTTERNLGAHLNRLYPGRDRFPMEITAREVMAASIVFDQLRAVIPQKTKRKPKNGEKTA